MNESSKYDEWNDQVMIPNCNNFYPYNAIKLHHCMYDFHYKHTTQIVSLFMKITYSSVKIKQGDKLVVFWFLKNRDQNPFHWRLRIYFYLECDIENYYYSVQCLKNEEEYVYTLEVNSILAPDRL